MQLGSITTFLISLLVGGPAPTPPSEHPADHYSGVEWVLDANGHLLGSTALVLEHRLDVVHRQLQLHVYRESPDAHGLFQRESVDTLTVLSTGKAPYASEARARHERGPDTELTEKLTGDMLVARMTVRDASGQVTFVHIINATPLTPCEHAARLDAIRGPTGS